MSPLDEIRALARRLTPAERAQLARELAAGSGAELPLAAPAPHSAAWLKSERGHAVLATDTGPAEAEIPAGAEAIAGMWRDRREETR